MARPMPGGRLGGPAPADDASGPPSGTAGPPGPPGPPGPWGPGGMPPRGPAPSRGGPPSFGGPPPALGSQPPALGGPPPPSNGAAFAPRPGPPGPPTPGSQGSFRGPSTTPFSSAGGLSGSGAPGAPSPELLAAQLESISLGPDAPGAPDATDPSLFPRPLMADGELGPTERQLAAPRPPVDALSCDPAVMRPAVAAVPNSMSLKSSWHLPLALVVRPLADPAPGADIAVVDGSQPNAILRCNVCRSYVSPYNRWTNGALLPPDHGRSPQLPRGVG